MPLSSLKPRRSNLMAYVGLVRNIATYEVGPNNAFWSPAGHAVRLLRMIGSYTVATLSASGTLSIIAYKNNTSAGSEIFQTDIPTHIFSEGDIDNRTVANAGNEIITPSDNVFFMISHDESPGAVDQIQIGLDWEEWYG